MPLAPGVRLGPYEIVATLGAGGMGEVYRARDTRLDRIVAIKVLAPELAADPQLRSRFDREARAISALNHPHICALYDVGREDDIDFLVLEHLDGQTLADRLTTGPLRPDEALRLATDVCDALDKAHRAGIVHRDLKPANIFLVRNGGASAPPTAKLLDFGLAKAATPVIATTGLSMLPTTPPGLTAQGTILGTFQYMAPEQIEGLDADARSDIFALGAVIFEMIAGRPAFEGKTRASLLGAILKDVPPRLSTVTPLSPPALDRIVATCLDKDPDDRYQSARDLLRDLKWAASADAGARPTAPVPQRPRYMWFVPMTAALLLVAAGALLVREWWPATRTEPIQFTVPPPENHVFSGGPIAGGTGTATQVAISPDGRHLAFVAADRDTFQLWVRAASTLAPRLLTGTDGASFPFWSPDGRQIAFFASGKLKKINADGGPAVVLCDAPGARGGTWSKDNIILIGSGVAGVAIQRVPAAGGVPTGVTKFDTAYGETHHRWPFFLPDGRHFLYTAVVGVCCPPSKPAEVRVGSLDASEPIRVLQADSTVQYGSGHLLFVRNGTLMAQAFDASALKTTADPFPVAEQVSSEGSRYASFAVSTNGVLAFGHGVAQTISRPTWLDRSGKVLQTIGEPAFYLSVALSPDERRIAVSLPTATGDDRDIWIIDAQRATTSRLTFDSGPKGSPMWSPDGSQIVFEATRDGVIGLHVKAASGTGADDLLLTQPNGIVMPTDWSRDGRFILYERTSSVGPGVDIWALPLFGDRKPFPVVATRFTKRTAVLSPDGRWVAYQSNETGIGEVYVQPFPPTGGKYQISRAGGALPFWRADGKELYFLSLSDRRLMVVKIESAGQELQSGVPERLFAVNLGTLISGAQNQRQFAVSKDGERFLVNMSATTGPSAEPITVNVNWLAGLQK